MFVGQLSKIDSFVWIFPHVVLTNDPTPPSTKFAGVHIHSFLSIAAGAVILPLHSDEDYEHIYHMFVIRSSRRDELEAYLNNKGIGTVKHYPISIHLQQAYKGLGLKEGSLPVAEEISKTVLSIPMYYGMTDEEVDYVVECLNSFE